MTLLSTAGTKLQFCIVSRGLDKKTIKIKNLIKLGSFDGETESLSSVQA